jgi:hypothetical protein
VQIHDAEASLATFDTSNPYVFNEEDMELFASQCLEAVGRNLDPDEFEYDLELDYDNRVVISGINLCAEDCIDLEREFAKFMEQNKQVEPGSDNS